MALVTPAYRWLFVCSANYIRSPTAEYVARKQGLIADSCGAIRRFSEGFVVQPITQHFIDWAHVIVCMEGQHVGCVMQFPRASKRRVFCWNLPDDYPEPYGETLVNIIASKLADTRRIFEREQSQEKRPGQTVIGHTFIAREPPCAHQCQVCGWPKENHW